MIPAGRSGWAEPLQLQPLQALQRWHLKRGTAGAAGYQVGTHIKGTPCMQATGQLDSTMTSRPPLLPHLSQQVVVNWYVRPHCFVMGVFQLQPGQRGRQGPSACPKVNGQT